MTVKNQRRLDAQGRIILPNHIRKALNLSTGSVVEVAMENGAIRIRPSVLRCSICGEGLRGARHATIKVGASEKYICEPCAKMLFDEKVWTV